MVSIIEEPWLSNSSSACLARLRPRPVPPMPSTWGTGHMAFVVVSATFEQFCDRVAGQPAAS